MSINHQAINDYLKTLKLTGFELIFVILPIFILAGLIICEAIRRKFKGESGITAGATTAFKIDYFAHESRLLILNPGLKIIFSLTLLILSILLNDIGVSVLIILFCAFMTTVIGGLSVKAYLRLMRIPLFFLIVGGLVILFQFSWNPPVQYLLSFNLHYFYVYLTANGVKSVLDIWARALGAVSAMYLMVLSTPTNELFGALERAHCPALIVELMRLIYRFIFTMMNTVTEMETAAKSRLGYRNYRTALKSFGQIGSNVLIVSLKKARAYYDALDSRLYNGRLSFLEEEKRVYIYQIFISALIIIYLLFVYFGSRYYS